jgi:hypothetical protein
MKTIENNYFVLAPLISVLMFCAGLLIKRYLNKAGLNNARQLGAFWVKFIANALVGFGVFCFLVFGISVYFYLRSKGYI